VAQLGRVTSPAPTPAHLMCSMMWPSWAASRHPHPHPVGPRHVTRTHTRTPDVFHEMCSCRWMLEAPAYGQPLPLRLGPRPAHLHALHHMRAPTAGWLIVRSLGSTCTYAYATAAVARVGATHAAAHQASDPEEVEGGGVRGEQGAGGDVLPPTPAHSWLCSKCGQGWGRAPSYTCSLLVVQQVWSGVLPTCSLQVWNPKPAPYPYLYPCQVCFQLWMATTLLADAVAVAVQSLLARGIAQGE